MTDLRVKDNDRDEITVMDGDRELRGWSYSHGQEQFWKMQMAREYVEGWHAGAQAEATVDQEVPKYAHQMVTRLERERMAQMLQQMYERAKPGPERAAYCFAINAIRRGRLLTPDEEMENLRAALDDKPVPHPAPIIAR